MKTSKSISMMIIGMMVFGTTTSFGKTNVKPGMNNNNEPRKEVRVNNNNDRNGFNDRNNGMRMNDNRTYRMDNRDMRPEPRPVPEPRPMDPTTSKVVTGVVVGTVIGSIISSLVK